MRSFAPSAAAVWHCDRLRITCESNSVRHNVLFKALGLAALGVPRQPSHNIIIFRLPAGYLTLIHVLNGIIRLVVQMFDEFVLVFSSVFAQCIPRRLVHLVFCSGYINRITYGFGFRSDQMYAIHLIDLRLEQSDL